MTGRALISLKSLFESASTRKGFWEPFFALWAIVSILVTVLLGTLAIFSASPSLVSCAVIVVASGYVIAILTAFHRAAEHLTSF